METCRSLPWGSGHLIPIWNYGASLLLEIGSVIIEPSTRGSSHHAEWAYSKMVIKKIMTPKECGVPYQAKYLKEYAYSPKTFTYFDYIKAWDNALFF